MGTPVAQDSSGGQRALTGVGPLLPPCGCWGSLSGHRAWWQMLLSAESSHQPSLGTEKTQAKSEGTGRTGRRGERELPEVRVLNLRFLSKEIRSGRDG